MPEIQYFTVTQVREVKVAANSITDAILLADAAFEHGQNSDNGIASGKAPESVWGNTRSKIRTTDIHVLREN